MGGLDWISDRDGHVRLAVSSRLRFNSFQFITDPIVGTELTVSFDILEHNLSALQSRQPEAAAMVRACELPGGLLPTVGRDGTPTLMIPGKQGLKWLGGSSMPRASAEEMFGQVDPRGGSVTLPAMLTGMEAMVLAERLAPRFAVFVIDEAQTFKVVLSLRDYQSHFRAGRIVLLMSDDIPSRASEFFARNPGFALPAHMFKVPQMAAGPLANLARTLEDAGAQAMRVQSEFIATQVNRLRAIDRTVVSLSPRIALLAADDSPATIELARRIECASRTLAATCEACLPVNPDQCHVAARVAAVERSRADLVFYMNGITPDERSLFPLQLPFVDWLSHGAALRNRTPGGSVDLVVTESRSDAERVHSAGWPHEQVVLMEPAADIAQNEISEEPGSVDERSAVVVMMDLPDDRPEAAGVTLPSHIALWKALQQEVLHRCDRFAAGDIGDVLRAAQQSSGTMLTDPSLTASFEGWLRLRIVPATMARSLGLALVKNGLQPDVWGQHWPLVGRGRDLRHGPIPSGESLHSHLNRPSWVVIPWFSHAGVQLAVEAMARGSVVVMRGTRDSLIAEYPALVDLADSICWFSTAGELVSTLRGLIVRHERVAETSRIVARRIRAEHTVIARLRGLIGIVRASQQRLISKGAT
jgi:hypothetical protein